LRVDKPWGYEVPLLEGPDYRLKRLVIRKGHRLSLQYHPNKNETWIIEKGKGTITIGTSVFTYTLGEIIDIPALTLHRIFASSSDTSVLEVSAGPEKTVRVKDDYERV